MGRALIPGVVILLAAALLGMQTAPVPAQSKSMPPAAPAVSADTATPAVSVDVWKDAKRSLPDVRERLRASGFRGVHLVGPAAFAVGEHESLPLMGFRIFSTTESFRSDFEASAVLVVVRPENNEVFAARVFPLREGYAPALPTTKPPEAIVASQFSVDVRARIPDLPWTPGTYLSTVLFEQQHSNRVRTHILPNGGKIARMPEKSRGTDVKIELEVPPVIGSARPTTTVIRGRLRQAGGNGKGAPSLPVTLVLIGQEHQEPRLARQSVQLPATARAGAREGAFEVDPGKLDGGPLLEQPYFVWAFSGEAFAGPYRMEVSAATTPRR